MAIIRKAQAKWNGSGKEGNGTLSTASGVLDSTPYSFNTRFGETPGTNPEELLGAAHAGCFSMKLAFVLNAEGFSPESIETSANVILDSGAITEIQLTTRVKVSGLDQPRFEQLASVAKTDCPVSKLFNATITLNAMLV